jgi:hypothetical protein
MKVIYSGLESSGKSLQLAMQAVNLVYRNRKWYARQIADYKKLGAERFQEKYKMEKPTPRPIASNLFFSKGFEKFASNNGIPLMYWENIDELIRLTNADVIIDEVGNYFDARMWTDISLDARRWLTQGAKQGIEIYGSAQDFAQVDKAFRRLVNELIHITKVIGSGRPASTKPPIKRIWGFAMRTQLDPRGYKEEANKFQKTGLFGFSFFLIQRKYCMIFDTTQKIKRSKATALRHIDKYCEDTECQFHRVVHV